MATIKTSQLKEFDSLTPDRQALISAALEIAALKLEYVFASADPARGGMDCSGFIHYLLTQTGRRSVPRASNDQYAWVRKKGRFYSVLSTGGESFELDELQPGDLLFWTNTYKVERKIPITHVMIYLGRLKSDGRRVMAGASEGRSFGGTPRFGVGVFDFTLPKATGEGRFVGYGSLPE